MLGIRTFLKIRGLFKILESRVNTLFVGEMNLHVFLKIEEG